MSPVCPCDGCSAVGHLECFASAFCQGNTSDAILPTEGKCPSCGTKHRWVDLVKEMTLRLRGEDEIKKIFKVKKPRVKKAAQPPGPLEALDEDSEEDVDDAPPLEDDWHVLSEDEEDAGAGQQIRSDPSPVHKKGSTFATYSEPVIEDSDWDDAEVLT